MSRRVAGLTRLGLALVLVMYAISVERWLASGVAGALLALSLLPWRGDLDSIGRVIVAVVTAAAAWALVMVLDPDPPDPSLRPLLVLRALLALFAILYGTAQLFLKKPWRGPAVPLAAGLAGLLALGGAPASAQYALVSGLFIVIALAALSAADPAQPSLKQRTPRSRNVLLGGLALAAGVAVLIAVALPVAHRMVVRGFGYGLGTTRSGFDTRLRLGALRGLLQSDEVALRLRGPRPDHLRGIVYSEYSNGRWFTARGNGAQPVDLGPPPAAGAELTEVETVSGEERRYFVPLDARHISTDSPAPRASPAGVLLPARGERAEWVRFQAGPREVPPVSRPDPGDLELPPGIKEPLERLATSWTAGATGVEERLQALQAHLAVDYRYSLEFTRDPHQDPVLDFLLRNRQGHCEYFASSMALLSRALGIPARVIGGYRVTEYNPLGGYYLVRQRNAHAWVEAWVPGQGWKTVEPTPAGGLAGHMDQESGLLAGIADLVRVRLAELGEWLGERTTTELALAIGAMLALWIGLRLVRRLRARRSAWLRPGARFREPLPGLIELLEILEKKGHSRARSEPLERFAGRVHGSAELGRAAPEISNLLRQYAAWRYGGKGEPGEIEAALRRRCQALSEE